MAPHVFWDGVRLQPLHRREELLSLFLQVQLMIRQGCDGSTQAPSSKRAGAD